MDFVKTIVSTIHIQTKIITRVGKVNGSLFNIIYMYIYVNMLPRILVGTQIIKHSMNFRQRPRNLDG